MPTSAYSKASRLLLLLAAGAAACASPSGGDEATGEGEIRGAKRVQMNDVSVLYPLPKTEAELGGYLTAASVGRGGPLLPDRLYTEATGEPKSHSGPFHPGQDAGLTWDDLRVVAFRIDPCFANVGPITNPSACDNQLRLILQPVSFQGAASTVDGAVHAFYSLTRDELVGLVKDLVKLRTEQSPSSRPGPLEVHPIVSAQGMLGPQAKGMNALVLAHAGKANLKRFTKFSPGNLATRWDFMGFTVEGERFRVEAIPTLPDDGQSVSFFAGFGADLSGSFNPPTQSKDDMQLLGNLAKAQAASRTDQQAAFDAALRIENPDKHSPNTIDCASCHVAGPARVLTGAKLGLSAEGNPNAYAPDPKLVSAAEMKQSTPVDDQTRRNFHVFSYRDAHPMIAMRVVNETAAVVSYLNGEVLE